MGEIKLPEMAEKHTHIGVLTASGDRARIHVTLSARFLDSLYDCFHEVKQWTKARREMWLCRPTLPSTRLQNLAIAGLCFTIISLLYVLLVEQKLHHADVHGNLVPHKANAGSGYRELESRIAGGEPGYYVLDNVWYHSESFHLYTSDPGSLPEGDEIATSFTGCFIHNITEDYPLRHQVVARMLKGTTLFVNTNQLFWWFYHFAIEYILGAFAGLSNVVPLGETRHMPVPVPDRLIIPWEQNWRDQFQMSPQLVKGLFGNRFIDNYMWKDMTTSRTRDPWIFFERLVIVDRGPAHPSDSAMFVWNKMHLSVMSHVSRHDYFSAARKQILKTFNIKDPGSRRAPGQMLGRVPKIVYVDRQSTQRHMVVEDHRALVELLKELAIEGKARTVHAKWEDIEPEDQFQVVSDADIIIGPHGNGLSHIMLMPEGGVVVELFPDMVFARHYQPVSESMGHEHYVIWEDHVAPRIEWEFRPHIEDPIHDGHTEIPLDMTFFRDFLDGIMTRMMETQKVW